MRWSVAVLVFSLATTGCGASRTHAFVSGPYDLGEHALFARVSEAARRGGYSVTSEDEQAGRLVVTSHTLARGAAANFVVQLYRPGWVRVVAEGPGVEQRGDRYAMPGALRDELAHFSIGLSDSLRVGAGVE